MESASKKEKIKILAALGPGDILNSFEFWRVKQRMPTQMSIPYSHQFFDVANDMDISAWLISSHAKKGMTSSKNLLVENRPKHWPGAGGVRFHLAQLLYAISLVRSALIFRPHIVMIDSGTTHYFLLSLFRLLYCHVVVDFHNVMWPRGFPPQTVKGKIVRWMDSYFFRYFCSACQGVSLECSRQANGLAKRTLPFFLYYAKFVESDFKTFKHFQNEPGSLKVIYVGRIEKDKGALDMLYVADILRSRAKNRVTFEICGDGGAIEELRSLVQKLRLESSVFIRGRLNRKELIKAYRRNHVVVVPTQKTFTEGFAMVVAEAVLGQRPVVTTSVVPALEILRPACLEALPNDMASFADCFVRLADDSDLLFQLSQACIPLRRMFLDDNNTYYRALKKTIEYLT